MQGTYTNKPEIEYIRSKFPKKGLKKLKKKDQKCKGQKPGWRITVSRN